MKKSINLLAKYYQENKERLQKKPCERYQNLSKEEKEKKGTIWSWKIQNLLEDEKQKLAECRKNIIESEKTLYYNYKKIF